MQINHLNLRRAGLLALLVGQANHAVHGAEPAPFAKIHPLAIEAVHWSSGFWAERFDSLRTDYGRYQAEGWFIGSGVIEAGYKTVVGRRLKR
ncbi:MAG: hypothetical protein H7A55_14575 [Verrucomicrobiaceae bacterium]|nr:hypothetical protein [Verrucomicrobiaceae bacterium]